MMKIVYLPITRLVILSLMTGLSYGYNIFIPERFSEEIKVFNASIGLDGCGYHVRDFVCTDAVPSIDLKIDETRGVITIFKTGNFLKDSHNTCSFRILTKGCLDGSVRVEMPFMVYLLPDKEWFKLSAFMQQTYSIKTLSTLNVTLMDIVAHEASSNSFIKILPLMGVGPVLPYSLLQCETDFYMPKKSQKSSFRIKDGFLSASVSVLCRKKSFKVELSQLLQDCNPNPVTDIAVVSNQKIAMHIHAIGLDNSLLCLKHRSHYIFDLRKNPKILSSRRRRSAPTLYFLKSRQSVDILENRPPGTEVITMDIINTAGKPVEFHLFARSDKRSLELFNLDNTTGTITTKRSLDRESMSSHLFSIVATSQGSSQATCTLVINVIDMNDNAPRFEETKYRFTLRESDGVGAYVGQVTASDTDFGKNAEIYYKFISKGSTYIDNAFLISNDGVITLREKVDREMKSFYAYMVEASDRGTPPQRSCVQIDIIVEDINDNSPRFSQTEYKVKISESTARNTKIAKVSATDSDDAQNGHVTYSLIAGSDHHFSVGRNTGDIIVISDINFANNPNGFRFRVRAQDGGRPPKSSTCSVVVSLIDVNDNAPHFLSSTYSISVKEDLAVGSDIIRVKAVDSDSGDNAKLTYSLAPSTINIPFRINNTSGQIFLLNELDYEKKTRYTITARATDHGVPQKHSDCTVEISVRNVDDNRPTFSSKEYRLRVAENTRVGSEIKTVEATDADPDTHLNYRIIAGNNNNKFGIVSRNNKGIITLALSLDFNKKRNYVLTVMCSDGVHTGTTKVTIDVTDANTYPPQFDNTNYEATVLEDVKIGTKVIQVNAKDKDVGENAHITYSFQNSVSEFSINPTNGEIKTKKILDYDTESQIYLIVIAKDNGVPKKQDSAAVTIYLEDVNDNAPVFDLPKYKKSVSEDVRVGINIVRIHATDKDSGNNEQIYYTFEGGNDGNGHFKIEQSTGIIRTANSLDREDIAEYTLIAYACDRGEPQQKTSVPIQITVTDVDDNPPHFEKDEVTFYVEENSSIGSVVATLHAVDPDDGEHSKVTYELSLDLDAMSSWHISFYTGELSPIAKLDYEIRSSYTFVVTATSNDLVSQVTVHIKLIDMNDNKPVLKDFQIIFNNYRTYKHHTFPVGPIGKIPAYDPDVSSNLTYRFVSGNEHNLLILNQTSGELKLSTKLDNDREFSTEFILEVTDGEFRVNGTCILKVVPITDEMLTNSVTVRVQEISQEKFLSTAMQQFVNGLGRILNVSSQDVFIFNVQNDTDVAPHAVVNVSFSARHPEGYFFTTQHLQEQVYLNRSSLTNFSMQSVMPFDDNICLREPCENYMRCVSALYFNSSAPFVSTQTVLFRPIHPVSGLRCKCPEGFAGQGCENEINLCHPSRCQNNGQCVSVEGGFICSCNGSFTGKHCEVNLVGSQCTEAKGICKNGAKCRAFLAGGFSCECIESTGIEKEDLTRFCQLRSRTFRKGDFAMFSGITQQWRFTLSLSFVTQESNGLLLYNGRFNHEHDYLALEIIGGQVQVNFSTGQDYTVVDPYIDGGVDDGKWHTVLVEYHNKPKREILGQGHSGPSNRKVVTVTVDPESCDPVISAKWHKRLGNYTCSKTAEQGGTKSSLDLTTPLLLGGVPNLPEQYQVRTRHFVGCLRDLIIEHSPVDMSSYVANHGSRPGCSAMHDQCRNNPCSHGTCETTWGKYKCICDGDYSGKWCERIQPGHQFLGRGCLRHNRVNLLPSVTLPWKYSLSFRTTHSSGTLIYVEIGNNLKLELLINEQKMKYGIQSAGKLYEDCVNKLVNDGEWHKVEIVWSKVGDGVKISIVIDDVDNMKTFEVTISPELTGATGRVTNLYLGGKLSRNSVVNAFVGCLRSIEFSSRGLVHNVQDGNLLKTRGARVTVGCKSKDACSSNPCPVHSTCVTVFDSYKCKCHKGYIGKRCEPACMLQPCHSGGQCILDPMAEYGYTCRCASPIYYGRTCEMEHLQPCPSGWHGYPVCLPCNCPIERNFDLDCNNKRGECVCKKNHYLKTEDNTCYACNCYHVGSRRLNCSDDAGQCPCKPGVIGKQCNKCSNKFAEVTDTGCKVLYDHCPQSIENGILWLRAKFDEIKPAQCPVGSVGIATRKCQAKEGWLAPVLNCTSDPYSLLAPDLKNLERNRTSLSLHYSVSIAQRLQEAASEIEDLYERDVYISYALLLRLLSYQKSLSGFDLTSAQDSKFNDDLVISTSRILDEKNLGHWSKMRGRKFNGVVVNSAQLLQGYEDYITTLTKNLQGIYYDSIISNSPNVLLAIHTVSRRENEVIRLDNNKNDTTGSNLVSVSLAPDETEPVNKNSDVSVVGVMQFNTLGQILPESFQDSRLDMRIPQKPFINSAVVSVVTHNRANKTKDAFKKDLIVLTFPLLRQDKSNPQCVFWSFPKRREKGTGGWSQKGCVRRHHNNTHVVCACSHLTSFAVLTDEEIKSVTDELPVRIVLYASVFVIVTCIVVTLVFSCCLQDVKSNHARIHNNFCIAILLSEICFVAGIEQTTNNYVCMAVAIFLHFFFMSTFAWIFVEGLHLYRMITEKRDVNMGHMRAYYLLGWGIPAIITALSVGLDAKGFGNPHFCWILTSDLLVWSFAGPLILCVVIYILLLLMTVCKYFASKLPDTKRQETRVNLRASFALLPAVGALWALALFAVNKNKASFYYLFAVVNVILAGLLLLFHCALNKEVRNALRTVRERRWQRAELNTTTQHLLKRSLSQTPDTSGSGARRLNAYITASSTSETNTNNRKKHQDSSMFHDLSDLDNSDTESDFSDSSISLTSTHTSDDEDNGRNVEPYLNINNSSNLPRQNGHLPILSNAKDRGLMVHSTPKDASDRDNHVFSPYNGSTSSRNESYKSPLPTLSEANSEQDVNDEPRYLSVSSRCDPGSAKRKEEKYEYIPLKEMDSLPKRGILKHGKKNKPPTPARVDSLLKHNTENNCIQSTEEETSLISSTNNPSNEEVAFKRKSPNPIAQSEPL